MYLELIENYKYASKIIDKIFFIFLFISVTIVNKVKTKFFMYNKIIKHMDF